MGLRLRRLPIVGVVAACGAPVPVTNELNPNQIAAPAPATVIETEAATKVPVAFRGSYDLSQAACAAPSVHRLTVSETELRFHESIGEVRQVTRQGVDTIEIAADYEGEGERWSARQQLRLGADGATLTVSGNDVETVRVRCGDVSAVPQTRWQSAASGEGDGLFFEARGRRIVTLFCPAGSRDLIVNVPAFRPVGSEERMSFGSGGTVVALVADVRGDPGRGGVSGRGPIPGELNPILSGSAGMAINYGAQNSGPHPAPPEALATAFVAGCRD